MKTGHIRITDNVYFEYYKLKKPKIFMTTATGSQWFKEYEVSKQLVEVENVFLGELSECWFYDDEIGCEVNYKVIDNQPCKAEIKDNKATIIELIK